MDNFSSAQNFLTSLELYSEELFTQSERLFFLKQLEKKMSLNKSERSNNYYFTTFANEENSLVIEIIKEWISKAPIPATLEGLGSIIIDADLVSETFNLSEIEKDIVRFIYSCTRIDILERFLCDLTDDYRYNFHNTFFIKNIKILSVFFGHSESDSEKALGLNSSLVKNGLFSYVDRGFIKGSSSFLRLVYTPGLKKIGIKNLLLSKASKGDLIPDDFNHIKEDFDLTVKLLQNSIMQKEHGINILFHGPPGTGKTEMAKTICSEIGTNLYSILESSFIEPDSDDDEELIKADRASQLEAAKTILKNDDNSVILFDEAEDIFNHYVTNYFGSKRSSKVHLNGMLENNATPIIWTTNKALGMDPSQLRRFTFILKFSVPPANARKVIWEKILNKSGINLNEDEIGTLSNEYVIPPSFATNAVKVAKLVNDKSAISRVLENFSELTGYSRKKTDTNNDFPFLTELLNADVDLETLTKRITDGGVTNFSICLNGPPGTGKSEFVRHLSEKIKLPVLKKRMSDLLGMYVGESEKNIAKAFKEASDKKMFLLLEEADSCLLDRNYSVNSWELTAVNEMLAWMESHSLPFACTTNLMNNLDRASLRRFTFKVKFGYLNPIQTGIAFRHFFGKYREVNISNLTPADFAVAAKKASILGVEKEEDILDLLKQEVELKFGATVIKGFS
jgi:SpoVK/Ycf46/Vps4 family AAA+-type ATPase